MSFHQPLKGIRVIDFCTHGAGPAGTPAHPPALPGLSFLLPGAPLPRQGLSSPPSGQRRLRRSAPPQQAPAALLPKDHQRPDG